MADDIQTWLEDLALSSHADEFVENGVDLDLLPEINNEDLKDLGVTRLADRKRILKAIAALEDGSSDGGGDNPNSPVMNEPSRPLETERRQVSVMFADLSGYTRLSGEVGAEKMHDILGHFFDRADAIVRNHGGTVDKHVGDAVMAVFGAPIAHSDDPARALRAALAIHDAMPDVSHAAGHKIDVHIGIASGQVVASGVGNDAHYTVTGESVNLSSRLTDAARAGETLVSEAVHLAVPDLVEWEDRGAFTVKGIAEDVRGYLAKGIRMDGATGSGRPFVGRRAELQQFMAAMKVCEDTGVGQAIYVRGEAGIGKSRLREEFEAAAVQHGFACHRSLVLDFGVGQGQDAIRTLVHSLLNLAPGVGEAARAAAAEQALQDRLLQKGQLMHLNDLLDLPQPKESRSLYDAMDNARRNQGKRGTVAALMRGLSYRQPLFVVIEDVHWAQNTILEYLAELTRTVEDQSTILIMTSRIEGDPLDQAWRASTGSTPLTTIDLRPLRRDDAMALAAEYFDASNKLALNCVERAEGNPLFLDQLLRSAETSTDDQVPGSVQSLVQARMDALDDLDRQAVQAAAILGQRFSLDALRHLIGSQQYTCAGLVERHLVLPEGEQFLFAHALVREGIYDSLLGTRRAELHRAAAAWFGDRDIILRAEHLGRANDPEAAAAFLDAARDQSTALRFETALNLAARGIELADDPVVKCSLICLRGDTLRDTGATEQSLAAFRAALKLSNDDITGCHAWTGMAEGLRISDQHEAALEALDKAEAAATQQGLIAEQAQIHYLRGNVYFPLGNIEGCLAEHQKSLGFARQVGSTEREALALGGLGDAYYLSGQFAQAAEQFGACIQLCREHGYGRIEVANRHMVGWSRFHLLEFIEARQDALDVVNMAAEVNHHRAEVLGHLLAGTVEVELGLYDAAYESFSRSLEQTRAISASNFEAQSLVGLAKIDLVRGREAEAHDKNLQAATIVREVGLAFFGPTVLGALAATTQDRAQRKAILAEAESVLDNGCVAHNYYWFARTAIEGALDIGAWDEAEHFATRLENYSHDQSLGWSDFVIAYGRALAAWGRGDRDAALVDKIKRLHAITTERELSHLGAALEVVLAAA